MAAALQPIVIPKGDGDKWAKVFFLKGPDYIEDNVCKNKYKCLISEITDGEIICNKDIVKQKSTGWSNLTGHIQNCCKLSFYQPPAGKTGAFQCKWLSLALPLSTTLVYART